MPGRQLAGGGDSKILDQVIVVTDLRVLDEQLRATVQQFENVPIHKRDRRRESGWKSSALAEASTGKARIVTVTLEPSPFVLEKISEALPARKKWASVVDEAHSSHAGEAAGAHTGVGGCLRRARDALQTKMPRSEGVREGGFEPPRPFRHRILRWLRPGTDPQFYVSSCVIWCRPVPLGVVLS